MTKRTFEMVAEVIRENRRKGSAAERWRCDEIARALASEFAHVNPRFNKQDFLDACDVGTEPL